MTRLWRLVVVIGPLAACITHGSSGNPSVGGPNDYAGALFFAGTAVGATAVNRAFTGQCYAACPTGYACNRDSGVCDRIACSCPADQICEIVGGRTVCTQPRPLRDQPVDAATDAPDAD